MPQKFHSELKSREDTVLWPLSFHLCDSMSNLRLGIIICVKSVVGSYPCFKGCSPGSTSFPRSFISQASSGVGGWKSLGTKLLWVLQFLEWMHSFLCQQQHFEFLYLFIYLFIYLSGYGFATFVMHDSISNKTCSIVQVMQKPLSFVIFSTIRFVTQIGFSKATNRKWFLVTFSPKYMLQIYKSVIK